MPCPAGHFCESAGMSQDLSLVHCANNKSEMPADCCEIVVNFVCATETLLNLDCASLMTAGRYSDTMSPGKLHGFHKTGRLKAEPVFDIMPTSFEKTNGCSLLLSYRTSNTQVPAGIQIDND